MDRLDSMRLLCRVIERGSFTAAAADMAVPRSSATEAIRKLEADLGARLLNRTTRHVGPTPDGKAYYRQCLTILADVEEAEGGLRGARPGGLLRIGAPGRLARTFLVPRLPDFLDRYPEISLQLRLGERFVDLIREGIDCVIRAGEPEDSSLIMRRLTSIPEATCASPDYLAKTGVPASPDALEGHAMIGFVSSRTGAVMPLEFTDSSGLREITLPSRVMVDDADTANDLARQGFGITQAPRYRFAKDFADGSLVEILADTPPEPTLLAAYYPQNRQLSPRVRVFVDWAAGIFAKADL